MPGPALTILALAAAAASAPSAAVPFELDNGHIFVRAFVNGQGPYRFGFDTGASGVGRADAALTAMLSLPKVDEEANSDGVKVATTDVVAVRSLRVGDLEKTGVQLLSRDYNWNRKPDTMPMMGIIARDFFADRVVTIDYPARTITFSRGELRAKDPGVAAYTGSLTIPVCFAAGCFPGKVDTGSSRSLVIPKDIVAKLDTSPPVEIGKGMRTNSVATLYALTLREPVRVGGVSVVEQKAIYTEPSVDAINIGSDFLKDYVLTIDQRHQLLRISRPVGK
jgi:hypothetical protein